MTTFLEALAQRLTAAGSAYAKDDVVAPAAILWPDAERQWEPLVSRLRHALPLFTLGDYAPDARTGPSYWLRCIVDRTLPQDPSERVPEDVVPVLYLPGIGKQEVRAVDEAPQLLKPLAELQYRGTLFTQKNGRDWTIAAFLQSADGGLGIEVASDAGTKAALLGARHKLADIDVEEMRREARAKGALRAEFFNEKVKPDIARNLLEWLNDPAVYQAACPPEEWEAFRAQCRATYHLDPATAGPVSMAEQLGLGTSDAWNLAWDRFADAPGKYPGVVEKLRSARPKPKQGTTRSMFEQRGRWPQDNEEAEKDVRAALSALVDSAPTTARERLLALEAEHADRRDSPWATLGQAPLARTLEHLADLATLTAKSMSAGTIAGLAEEYAEWAWRADDAALRAMAAARGSQANLTAVKNAVRTVYQPWLEQCARVFQAAADGPDFRSLYPDSALPAWPPGTCVMFCDGLRLDLAHRLEGALKDVGLATDLGTRLTALPSITTTAKPAVSPVASAFTGAKGLDPVTKTSGSSHNVEVLRKLLDDASYQVLVNDDLGDPAGRAWTEARNIDNIGHNETATLPVAAGQTMAEVAERVAALLAWGWQQVVVVTDHGWLYLPGGLPKSELAIHLAEQNMRKGRCARLKEGAMTDLQTVPWHWDTGVRIALAPGICCFQQGKEYEHGGLSPQECVTPVLTVRTTVASAPGSPVLAVKWRNMRCDFEAANAPPGAVIDIRTKAGDAATSRLTAPRALDSSGKASALIEDDALEGHAAFAVLVSADGVVLAQASTTIGGGD